MIELKTGAVAMLKVADVAPDATVTLVGTVAFELFDDRDTTNPPVGAAL